MVRGLKRRHRIATEPGVEAGLIQREPLSIGLYRPIYGPKNDGAVATDCRAAVFGLAGTRWARFLFAPCFIMAFAIGGASGSKRVAGFGVATNGRRLAVGGAGLAIFVLGLVGD